MCEYILFERWVLTLLAQSQPTLFLSQGADPLLNPLRDSPRVAPGKPRPEQNSPYGTECQKGAEENLYRGQVFAEEESHNGVDDDVKSDDQDGVEVPFFFVLTGSPVQGAPAHDL